MKAYSILLTVLGILFLGQVFIKFNETTKEAKSNIKNRNYYFYQFDKDRYVQADKQRFRLSITGEVLNCYFWKDNKKYSTCEYYKKY